MLHRLHLHTGMWLARLLFNAVTHACSTLTLVFLFQDHKDWKTAHEAAVRSISPRQTDPMQSVHHPSHCKYNLFTLLSTHLSNSRNFFILFYFISAAKRELYGLRTVMRFENMTHSTGSSENITYFNRNMCTETTHLQDFRWSRISLKWLV